MTRRAFRWGRLLVLLALLLPATASAQIPPGADYRQFETRHFRVIFPERFESFALATAERAEHVYAELSRAFVEPPDGRIALVITDRSDGPGGDATPVPRNRISIVAAPHISETQFKDHRDWIELTLAHELTHIFHLDRAEGLWTVPRTLFGRFPLFFPALYQPRWVSEGLATYYESRLTGAGRAYGSYFRMVVTGAARADEFRTVDAANGLTPVWPAGQTPYAYGGLYVRSLAEAHGDSALGRFVRAGAAVLPYTVEWAAPRAFGRTLSAGWEAWRAEFSEAAAARADSLRAEGPGEGEPLSEFGWVVSAPRFSHDGRRLAVGLFTARNDPQTLVVDVDAGTTLRTARRNTARGQAWSPDGSRLYYDQSDFVDRYRIRSDLYAWEIEEGRETRLTVGAALSEPDLGPAGREIVAVQVGAATNRLVVLDVPSGRIRPITTYADGVAWARPRWSPDGARIAAERWTEGHLTEIVLLDPDGSMVTRVTDHPALDLAPAWSPDGRYMLWSSDRGGTFNIYATELAAPAAAVGPRGAPPGSVERTGSGATETAGSRVWKVTDVIGGALDPDISPDGRWLAYVAHHSGGFRVERVPFDRARWRPAPETPDGRPEPIALSGPPAPVEPTPVREYSPFPSLWPTAWLPVVLVDEGAGGTLIAGATFGADDLERHRYAALLGWRTGIDEPQLALGYIYSGLGDPTLQLSVAQDWSTAVVAAPSGAPVELRRREREVRLAARFLRPRIRNVLAIEPSVELERFDLSAAGGPPVTISDPTATDLEVGAAMAFSTARRHPRSVSSENGFATRLDLAHARRLEDAGRWRVSAEVELRGYLALDGPGFARHVLGGRLAVGLSSGRSGLTESFALGGTPARPAAILAGLELGGGSTYAVRGYGEGVQRGDRVASGSLEYRFPIVLVGRGYKLWPVLLDRISGSAFVDGGAAWRDSDRVRVLASAGAELSVDLGLGYLFEDRVRVGVARQLVAPAAAGSGWSAFVAAGTAF